MSGDILSEKEGHGQGGGGDWKVYMAEKERETKPMHRPDSLHACGRDGDVSVSNVHAATSDGTTQPEHPTLGYV